MRLSERPLTGQIKRWSPAVASLPALVWTGMIFALSSRSKVPEPFGLAGHLMAIAGHLMAIAGHFTVYAVLAVLLWWALEPHDVPTRWRFLLALAGAVAYGLTDEWHQSFVPGRDAPSWTSRSMPWVRSVDSSSCNGWRAG